MNQNKSSPPSGWVVIIIIIILIIFLVSLGSIGSNNIVSLPVEFKDTKEEAKRKHKRLLLHIEKQLALKERLAKKFKRIYFCVRLGLVIIWSSLLSVFYFVGLVHSLSDALNYSEASILFIFVLNFLTFGTITNLKNYLDLIKTKTENWVYGKYVDLDIKIEMNKNELANLNSQIIE